MNLPSCQHWKIRFLSRRGPTTFPDEPPWSVFFFRLKEIEDSLQQNVRKKPADLHKISIFRKRRKLLYSPEGLWVIIPSLLGDSKRSRKKKIVTQ